MDTDNRHQYLSALAGRMRTWGKADGGVLSRVATPEAFAKFKISETVVPCHSCGKANALNPPAPVLIAGDPYCVWCALEMASQHLTPKEAQALSPQIGPRSD
jgi:hypothetical protein